MPILQRLVVILAAVATVLIVIWLQASMEGFPLQVAAQRNGISSAPVDDAAHPAHPLPPSPLRALPPLAASDASVRDALRHLKGGEAVLRFLAADELIRRFVLTADRLAAPTLGHAASPLVFPPRPPMAHGHDSRILTEDDFARYRRLVDVFDAVEPKAAVALYWRLYPLVQQAFSELRPARGYFNDRLVEVIDNLLQTPAPGAPVEVSWRDGRYRFADPRLESCTAGQKILLRMGPANAARMESKLREVRKLLALRAPAR